MAKSQPRVLDKVEDGTRNARRRFVKITAKEVSMVDEGANGREFLVVKAAGNTEDGMGGKADKDKGLMKGGADAGELTVSKATDIVKLIDAEVTKCVTLGTTVEVAKNVAPEQFGMFAAMADALDFCMRTMNAVRNDLVLFVQSGGTTGFMGEKVVKSTTVEDKLAEARDEMTEKVAKAVAASFAVDVEAHKRGKKMAKSRLAKLKDACMALTDLVKELDDEPVSKEAPVTTTAAAPAAPAAPAAATTQQAAPAVTTAEAAPAAAAPAATTSAPAAQVDVQKAVEQAVSGVGAAVEAAVAKAVKPLEDRLAKLESAPGKPAAEGANGTEEPAAKAAGKKSLFAGVL